MNFDFLDFWITSISAFIWGFPIIFLIFFSGLIFSFVFNFVQIVYFKNGFKNIFKNETELEKENDISPFQAFINTLSISIGNGALAGMAVALSNGGPGVAFWVFILGFFAMAIRFAEVYAGISFFDSKSNLNGPLSYIKNLPYGNFWIYCYSFAMIPYIFFGGISMQTNSISLSLEKSINLPILWSGILFAFFTLYIIIGGSKRIMKVSEFIIPIKVLVFFISIILVFFYHIDKFFYAINLILKSAFNFNAISKGIAIFSLQEAISSAFSRATNATEAGVGTASIFFSATDNKNPIKSSLISMISAFISTNLVCSFLVFVIVLSGISINGLVSTQIVIAAYETVFGKFAAPIVTFLSLSFGLGVLVSYVFLAFKSWEFIFNKKTLWICTLLLPIFAFLGSVFPAKIVFKSLDIFVGVLVFINIIAILWNLPFLKEKFNKDIKKYND
jgi:AGCS family alanine or glycine:cation symporter